MPSGTPAVGRFLCALLAATAVLSAANPHLLIRTVDGKTIEGEAVNFRGVANVRPDRILSIHSAAPASDFEKARIDEGIAAIQTATAQGAKMQPDARKASDLAVEELTSIGLPVMTPLLKTYKDTDQHEPRPLYRLFERVIPSHADGFDRTLSLIRLKGGEALRVVLPADGSVEVKGEKIPWSKIRMLAVRQAAVTRQLRVHSIQHSIQIEYLDTGLMLDAQSKFNSEAKGFGRLSWDADSWASDPNGLTKPGSPAYKSHLINGHPFGALIARVGAGTEPMFLGKKAQKSGLASGGRLGLAINDNGHWQNNLGTYTVTVNARDVYDVGDPQ
jgi:hypothetical protein